MNRVKLTQYWLQKHQVKLWFLYLAVLFLPLSMRLNNYFLGLFVFVFIIEGATRIKFDNIKKNYKGILLIAMFFFIIAFGLFNSQFIHKALKQIERSIPLLVIPLIFLSEPKLYYKNSKLIFLSLTIGCLIAAFVCWGYLAYNLISKDEFYRIFTWEYSKLNLIKPLDMHAPYLAMFLFTSIGFLIASSQIKNGVLKWLKNSVILILMLFFFHLLSRTAIIYFIISALVYLFFNKKYKTIIAFIVSIGLLFLMLLKN